MHQTFEEGVRAVEVIECSRCINDSRNRSIRIDDGLCNVCRDYDEHFDRTELDSELEMLKKFISDGNCDCLIGMSGGKDSTAMLSSVLELGFHPTAFSFQIGYNGLTSEVVENLRTITRQFKVNYEVIDAREYVTANDRKCFEAMADVYACAMSNEMTKEEFREIYFQGRRHYSTKDETVFPFVRPCQICRKIAIRAYYDQAVRHGVRVVFIGINEWASKRDCKYSALRRLQPSEGSPPVYIVHLPYLLQRKYREVLEILRRMSCLDQVLATQVETGGNSCSLARACEGIAFEMLGFHLDAARLSREVTVGFIDRKSARRAVEGGRRRSEKTVREVLTTCELIN